MAAEQTNRQPCLMLYPISVPSPKSGDDLIGFVDEEGRISVQPSFEVDPKAWTVFGLGLSGAAG